MRPWRTRNRDSYVREVIAELEALLTKRHGEMPTGFRIKTVRGVQSDRQLEIELEPGSSIDGWHDCEQVFRAVADELNQRFRTDKWYHGIQVFVPHEFMGKPGAEARIESIQRERDTAEFRSVRSDKDGKDG